MSIIQEALKKAQGDYIDKKVEISDRPFKYKIAPARPDRRCDYPKSRKSKVSKIRISVLTSILLALALIALGQYGLLMLPKSEEAATASLPVNAVKEPAAPPPQADGVTAPAPANPPVESVRPGAFLLNGIMSLDGTAQAIINGYVLEVGDKLNGAQVLLIDKDYVILDIDGANIKLRLSE